MAKRKILILRILRQMYGVFNPKQRLIFIWIIFLLIIQSIIEVVGLGFILAVLYIAQKPERIYDQPPLNEVYSLMGFQSESQFLIILVLGLILAFLAKNFFSIWLVRYQAAFSLSISQDLIDREITSLFHKDYLHFKGKNSNRIIQDTITIPIEFGNSILQPTLFLLAELFIALIILVGVAIYNELVLLGLVLTVGPPIVLFYNHFQKKIVLYGLQKNNIRPEAYKHAFSAIHGIETVKITHSENFFRMHIIEAFGELFDKMKHLVVYENVPIKVIELTAILSISFIVIYSVFGLDDSSAVLELLVVFATAAYRMLPSLNRISSSMVKINGASYVMNNLTTKYSPTKEEFGGQIETLDIMKTIELSNISFAYPENKEKAVISNLSIRIEKGLVLGIIGKSGEGKSTLLKILLKLIEPDSGTFRYNDQDVTKSLISSYQNKIGYVQQKVFILDGTVEENVAFGQSHIDRKKVEQCLKMAQLSDFVYKLPKGLKTKVGEFGSSLSGGQIQRIAIARALYREAEVLIFDEATSALDNDTEKSVLETIETLKLLGLTVIIVAHRISSLALCDKVLKLQNGKLETDLTISSDNERCN